jgi:hypothetical protein
MATTDWMACDRRPTRTSCPRRLRAESEDALRAFYDDPDYAGPKALRQSITANVNGIIAPEFTSLG